MKKQSKFKKLIIPLFIVFIMVFSIFGYMANRSDNSEKIEYNDYNFIKSDLGWITYKDDNPILIQNNPSDLEEISDTQITIQDLNSAQKIYLTFNPEEDLYYALNSFTNQITPLIGNFIQACTKDVPKCSNLPLKTCSDATDLINVIQIQENSITNLEYTNNCLIIQGKGENLTKAIDKLTLVLNGI